MTIRSLQVVRSSTLLLSVRSVDWTSELRPPPCPGVGGTAGQSSPESSEGEGREDNMTKKQRNITGKCFARRERHTYVLGIAAAGI